MSIEENAERTGQLRRTKSVRRGVVAAGATGALGAALAIGTTIHATGATESSTTDEDNPGHGDVQGFDQAPQGGQLAAPGGAGPAQGRSGGS